MPWPYHSGTTYGITESIQESECYGMTKIIGKALPNIPWEDKPAGETMPMWRFSGNPIIGRHGNKRANSVFNSAVVPFEDGFAGVFRCDSRSISMDLFAGRSKDGYHWEIEESPRMEGAEEEIIPQGIPLRRRLRPWTASTISPGAMATMAPPLALHGRRTSKLFINWKMLSCPLTAMACCSPGKSAVCI